mgnify:CR=1 FL=1|tara:strand:- start:11325 stop:11543 length:219 start_codon:yes stop_codon:yes gene_type:complete
MKKFVLVFSLLITSCNLLPDKVNIERRGFIEGCTEGSKKFIQIATRRLLPYEQVEELKRICAVIYNDYKGLK